MLEKQLGFIDILSIASFVIALQNLDENLTQGDKQDLQEELSHQAKTMLGEIHDHLEAQNKKLDIIIGELTK